MSCKLEQGMGSWTPGDVIDALGFGPAQIQYLLLAHGIWFVESMQVGLSVVLTIYVATEESWSNTQRASLSSLLFVGIAIGCPVGGYLGDRFGRRPPILLCYAMAGIAQLIMIMSNSFWFIAVLRVVLGFTLGLGMPPSLALVSETSPVKYRSLMQGLRNIVFAGGQIVACVVVLIDDPSYQHLHWRICLFTGAILPLVILPVVAFRMHDSPTLLAHHGRHDEARKSLIEIQRINSKNGGFGTTAVDVTYSSHGTFPQQRQARESNSLWEQLNIICGPQLFFSTLTLVVTSFTVNCVLYGHMYAFPLVATAEASDTAMKPGYQTFMQASIAIPTGIAVALLAHWLSCKSMITIGGLLGATGTLMFAATGGLNDRSGLANVLYFVSQNIPAICTACGFLGAFQLSVELYPVHVAATSAAVVIASGRIGSISISYIYEMFETWQSFYHFLTALSLLTSLMSMTLLVSSPPSDKQHGQNQEDAEAKKPLITK